MSCPKCQTENPVKAKFCKKCGQSLQTELICSHCSHANPPAAKFCLQCGQPLTQTPVTAQAPPSPIPTSFANGRYQVKKFLGEGGKKKVYLAHDTVLDRDVAFALIKTEKLDETALTRITREAQAMGKLGRPSQHRQHLRYGRARGQPYIVIPLMPGGDVEGLIEKAPDHRLPSIKPLKSPSLSARGWSLPTAKGSSTGTSSPAMSG